MDNPTPPTLLSNEDFKFLVKNTNLIAIDLVIETDQGILLGKRKNSPAKNFWFVPGGRIFKNEKLRSALERILRDEVGLKVGEYDYSPIGVFDHLYPNENKFNEPGFGTHYIVIALSVSLREGHSAFLQDNQHEEFKMLSPTELLAHPQVHHYVKAYFQSDPENALFSIPRGKKHE